MSEGTGEFTSNGQLTEKERGRIRGRLQKNVGPTAQERASQWVRWGELSDILGQPFDVTVIPLSKLHQMRRDPILAFGLQFCKVPLIRAPWYIEAKDELGARPDVSAFVDGALRRIYARYIFQSMNKLDFGFSAIAKAFRQELPNYNYFDRETQEEKLAWPHKTPALVWDHFVALRPDDVLPNWASDGSFNGIDWRKPLVEGTQQVRADSDKSPDIPLELSLWSVNEKDTVFGSLWGYARLAYAYRYWWSYWFRWALADRQFEKDADPTLIVRYPTGPGYVDPVTGETRQYEDKALEIGEYIRSGATAALPSDLVESLLSDGRSSALYKWDIKELEQRGNLDVYDRSFDYMDVAKLRSIMVPEQALIEGKGGTSSRNVASTFGDAFEESQAVLMAEADDEVNHYVIPQLVEANFGRGITAKKVTRGFSQADRELMKQLVQVVGGQDPLSLEVDLPEMLQQLGIPLMSPAALAQQRERLEEEANAALPPEVDAFGNVPGVTATGFYYAGRERIDLDIPAFGEVREEDPFIVEFVDKNGMPDDETVVHLDQDAGILYIREDVSVKKVQAIVAKAREHVQKAIA